MRHLPTRAYQGQGGEGGVTLLLAKSRRHGRALTLEQHLADTEQAAAALFRCDSRWGRSFLRFFKLEAGDQPKFLLNLRIAALLHDIGKANEGFLEAVTADRFVTQPFRHEHLSAIVLASPAVRRWLGHNRDLDVDIILAAVLSHHLKAAQSGDWRVLAPQSAVPTRMFLDDQQVRATFARIAALASLPPATFRLPDHFDHADWSDAWSWFWDQRVPRFGRELRSPTATTRRALCLAVKAGVIAADSVASAAFREDLSLLDWIEGVAHLPALGPDAISGDIISPRIAQISGYQPHRFQDGAAGVGRRALLLAGCGMGKTLAAWRWADAVTRGEPIGRVIFLYPTRGTATEGFRDYVGHAPEGQAALVHGTAKYELQGMQENPQNLPRPLQARSFAVDEGEARLFALGLWGKRYFSATVDQFLSFIEHDYGGLCLLPALADSAVVFDEIHSYDANMWNALISFLQHFDVPVLCMTATLAPTRRTELARLLRVYPDDQERADLDDLEAAETHPRYHFEPVADEDAAFAQVVDAVKSGQRVLWVVNTVRRCQQLARRLGKVLDGVLTYHSRYKLADRQDRHRATVDSFLAPASGEPRPAIAVTTQVCEMSLDLDADVLVTEHAPISSLVQRFGRANRHLRRGPAFRARILTYAPESNLPYERDDLDAAQSFLATYANRDASQRDLAIGLATHAPQGRDASGATRFIDGGYFATPGALRDTDDTGAPVILDVDIPQFRRMVAAGDATDGLRLTVPKRFAREPNEPGLPTWLRVADANRYDPLLGFSVEGDAP
jgi:CRISPR-associated endonuclease/helicase Cas3